MDADFLRDLFSAFRPVVVRRMFGGAGIYADGVMFALIADEIIYLKADDGTAAAFEQEGLPPFTYSKKPGQQAVMSYRRMPDRCYDDPDEVVLWAARAFEAASRKKAPVPRTKARKRKAAAKGRRLTRR
jgi:DNA transformation protein and related proteins